MHQPRRALRHDVRDGIVRSILEGEVGPGDRLIEMHIAREYGTSQGPVREALRELEMLGFVRSVPHRGTYVRDPWQRGMLELYDVRAALEEFAARLATPRLSDDVTALQAEVDGMAEAARRNDVQGVIEHSEGFHRLIVEASDNRLLLTMWGSLGITDHTAMTMVALDLDMATVAESHQPIVDAIAGGDVELACRVSREHQAWFVEMLNAQAQQREGEPQESSSKSSTGSSSSAAASVT
jgi:DNA-binding GntR family transcriptional regulator